MDVIPDMSCLGVCVCGEVGVIDIKKSEGGDTEERLAAGGRRGGR